MDLATRWPEAIPIRKASTAIVVNQLKGIFCRNGFPTTLVSDNGPQFCSKNLQSFLKQNGISHVKVSPYHPQGNGIVEKMHRTLKEIISKTIDKRGNWDEVALYFLRATHCMSSGFSPSC